MRKDPVTPQTHDRVIRRDTEAIVNHMMFNRDGMTPGRARREIAIVCIAPLVDPSQSGKCWGRSTLDHVKEHPRMAKRAPSDTRHLVTLCEGHTENGARAGYQWNTAHRAELREWLATNG